jgi:hypothetical protein
MGVASWVARLSRSLCAVAEATVYLCGIGALIVVVRQILFLLEYVTVGPLPLPVPGSSEGTAVYYAFSAVGLDWEFATAAWGGGLVLVLSGWVLARRVRRNRGPHAGALVIQSAMLLALLAWSYRFAGLVVAVALVCWLAWRPVVGWRRWVVWAVMIAICAAPYDITCRNLSGPPRFEPAIPCSTDIAIADYVANRRVCVGSDGLMYNEPVALWVW